MLISLCANITLACLRQIQLNAVPPAEVVGVKHVRAFESKMGSRKEGVPTTFQGQELWEGLCKGIEKKEAKHLQLTLGPAAPDVEPLKCIVLSKTGSCCVLA